MALLSSITNVVVKKPVKPSILIAYQREYYNTRVKKEFEEQWLEETKAWAQAVMSGQTEGVDAPVILKTRTRAAKIAWERESQEFRDDFIKTNQEQHEAILDLFERKNDVPETPEDYAKYASYLLLPSLAYTNSYFSALEYLPCVVNDLVQGLSTRFGMVTSILMCGPIPTKGGTIDVVRYVLFLLFSKLTLTFIHKYALLLENAGCIENMATI